jgi:L-histidine Nalpha-methyltransferase
MARAATEHAPRVALYEATGRGLRAEVKSLPTFWLYDERGSRLYDEIAWLPEYYPPRREAEILQARSVEVAERTRARTLVELGAGTAKNIRFVLDALVGAGTLEHFLPLDLSEETVRTNARAIAAAYPRISVDAVVGDFERDLEALHGRGPRLIAFLGSTIGNLGPDRRARFLAALAGVLGPSDALLLGVDLVKDVVRLEAAYNDRRRLTEAFVRNALTAVNRELDATFDQQSFAYEAHWDAANEWMDIGFRARTSHVVSIRRLPLDLAFRAGEPLRVEISAKFRRERVEAEAALAGLRVESWWTDRAGDFAVALVRPEDSLP